MNKQDLEDRALQYALGTLPEEEIPTVEAALRADLELRAKVHDWQRVNELEALEAADEPVPFHAYSGVMARIDAVADRVSSAPSGSQRGDARRGFGSLLAWSGWGIAACAVIAFALNLGGGSFDVPGSKGAEILLSEMRSPSVVAWPTPKEELTLYDRSMRLRELAETYWFARDRGAGQSADASLSDGFSVFDRESGLAVIAVDNLRKLPDDRTYHVWIRIGQDGEAVRAGALPLGNESRGLFFLDLSSSLRNADSSEQLSFFVTEESLGEPQAPKGMVVLR